MTRKEFLSKVGLGAAFVLTSACLGSCTKVDNKVDFVLDLTAPENQALGTEGGYIVQNNVVIARSTDGTYLAATRICSHENRNDIIFRNDEFYCTAHGARFNHQGTGLNNKGNKGITVYNTALSNTQLRVFS